ncbi:MAG: CHAP domain-containing protein [Microthrixaceae bacterium]|nr:CHAP domain-containing protein [Microthrixaceae bacterium]MCO5317999.1 CHAP domain-containing protein [Microthrixaceae bacterium]
MFAAAFLVALDSEAASAAPPPGVLVDGSAWLQGKGVDVRGGGGQWQCVELPQMRLYPKFGWPRVYAAGNEGAAYIPEGSPGLVRHNPGSGYRPVPGDLIIENPTSKNPYGHVAVVDRTEGNTIHAVEQNASSTGRHTYAYNNSHYSGGYGTVKAVLHAPQNHFKNPGDNVAANTQMLENASFEAGSHGWKRINKPSKTNFVVYNKANKAHNGSRYLETNTSASGGSVGQDVPTPVKANRFYRLRVWVWAARPASVRAQLWAIGGTAESAHTTVKVPSGWSPVDVLLRPTRNHSKLRAELYMLTTGVNVRLDDASLKWSSSKPDVLSKNPTGGIDAASSPSPGSVRVRGWALDSSSPAESVRITAYLGAKAGQAGAERRNLGRAAAKRSGLPGWAGPNHGFDARFDTGRSGRVVVHLYAENIGEGSRSYLGARTVEVAAAPTVADGSKGSPVPGNRMPRGAIALSVTDGRGYGLLGWAVDPDTGAPVRMRIRINGVVARESDWNYTWADMPAHTGVGRTESLLFLARLEPGENTICLDGLDASGGGWEQLDCRTHLVK